MERTALLVRAKEYAERAHLAIEDELGGGIQGIVFGAENQVEGGRSAVKVHRREADYLRERDAYLRLSECGVTQIRGCNVPQLIAYDDELWVVEMSIVVRPFVLDFGGAFLDRPPNFSEENLAEWREQKVDQFGARWPDVESILGILEGYGVYVVDVNPNNISFGI